LLTTLHQVFPRLVEICTVVSDVFYGKITIIKKETKKEIKKEKGKKKRKNTTRPEPDKCQVGVKSQ
jgi:hypothetical protein